MAICRQCGQAFDTEAEKELQATAEDVCPDCTAQARSRPFRLPGLLKCKWIGAALLILFIGVSVIRESGLYDFYWCSSNSQTNTSYRTSRQGGTNPLQLIRWTEVPDGILLDYENGSQGMLTIDLITYQGCTLLPFYKWVHVDVQSSFRSQEGTFTGTAEGTTGMTVKGICSSRGIRQGARNEVLNQICRALAEKRL